MLLTFIWFKWWKTFCVLRITLWFGFLESITLTQSKLGESNWTCSCDLQEKSRPIQKASSVQSNRWSAPGWENFKITRTSPVALTWLALLQGDLDGWALSLSTSHCSSYIDCAVFIWQFADRHLLQLLSCSLREIGSPVLSHFISVWIPRCNFHCWG